MATGPYEIQQEIAELIAVQGKEEIRDGVRETARQVRDTAKVFAPVYHGDEKDIVSGAYRDSIVAEDAPDHDKLPAAKVISRSRIAHLLEWGTIHMEEFAVFAKAANKFGGTVNDAGGPDHSKPGTPIQ